MSATPKPAALIGCVHASAIALIATTTNQAKEFRQCSYTSTARPPRGRPHSDNQDHGQAPQLLQWSG